VQAVALFSITNSVAIGLYPGLACRSLFNAEGGVASASEFAITLPVMLDVKLFGSPLHAAAGIQVDIPFGIELEWDDGEVYGFEDRASMDLGMVFSLIVHVNKNIFIDARCIHGLTNFAGRKDGRLNQFSIGAGWLF
jgi:hypothetical protein